MSAGDGRELIPAVAVDAPDVMGFVPLKEPVTIRRAEQVSSSQKERVFRELLLKINEALQT